MDVTSLYTNIPHEEGVTTVCHAYEDFYGGEAPIPTKYLREMVYLILQKTRSKDGRWPLLLQTSSWPESRENDLAHSVLPE